MVADKTRRVEMGKVKWEEKIVMVKEVGEENMMTEEMVTGEMVTGEMVTGEMVTGKMVIV